MLRPRVGWNVLGKDIVRQARWWVTPSRRRSQERRLRGSPGLAELVRISTELGGTQKPGEILPFLELALDLHPRRVCEIGTSFGGTTFLLARALPPTTTIIGIDLYVQNRTRIRRLRRPGQRIHLIDGDTHDPATRRKVDSILAGEKLDVLFVDGDHTREGVAKDLLRYHDLVRDGGLIAFHDIQPDGSERGLVTGTWVGGVPTFWNEIKTHFEHHEFIESPDQFGFGIGVIRYSPSVELTAILSGELRP